MSLVNIPDGLKQEVLALPEDLPGMPIFPPSGRRAIFGTIDESTTWTWVDLVAGTSKSLDALDGYRRPYTPLIPGGRWLPFFPSETAEVASGAAMLGLDLETGTLRRLLVFDNEESYVGIQPFSLISASKVGRFSLVIDLGANSPRFWLLDAEQERALEFPGRAASALSPDGRIVLAAEPIADGESGRWRLHPIPIGGTDAGTLAESSARGGVWVPFPVSR